MSKFRVLKYFTDLQDNNYVYREGDIFPRDGVKVSNQRVKELSTTSNRRGIQLIESLDDASEATEKPSEASIDTEGGLNTSKKPRAKKSAKKTQGDI